MSVTLAITPGDPTGIGPEITVKALQHLAEFPNTNFIIVGSRKALEASAAMLKLPLPENERVRYQPVEAELPGTAAYKAIDVAVRMIAAGEARALVTGPISKTNLRAADYQWPGHTEILEDLARKHFHAKDATAEMLFVYKNFRLLLLTRHVPLAQALKELSVKGAVARPLKTLIAHLRHQLKIEEPHIALLGINPHAGEVGGEEEKKYIMPVVHAVNAVGASKLAGPFAADGFFRGFDPENPGYDAVVAAYHDQGLIPFKILAGHEAVNVTIGLPFLRTSVSHGTAEDIAGKGIASENSLIAAIRTALNFS